MIQQIQRSLDSANHNLFLHIAFIKLVMLVHTNTQRKVFKQKIKDEYMNKGRKISGGKYVANKKKKFYEIAGQRRIIKLGEEKRKTKRTKGGNIKTLLLGAKFINVITKAKKQKRAEIKNVLETPSNRFLARQNVITKGAILETDLGKVKVTNRPSQEGIINGILIE